MKKQTCYRCENIAESSEHVPPKCFFPMGMRVNLFTVPSCKIHNEDTSKDDEYVRNLVCMTKGVNQVGKTLFLDKGQKSLSNSSKLLALTMKNPKIMNWIKDDDATSSITFEVDRDRFDRTMEKIAYGLYHLKFKRKWSYELVITTKHFVKDDNNPEDISGLIDSHDIIKNMKKTYGINPDVFQFRFFNLKENDIQFLLMKFYGFFEVWALPKIFDNSK